MEDSPHIDLYPSATAGSTNASGWIGAFGNALGQGLVDQANSVSATDAAREAQGIAQSDEIQLTRLREAELQRVRDAAYGFSEVTTGSSLGLRADAGLGMSFAGVRAEPPEPVVYDDGASLMKQQGAARLAQEFGPGALQETGGWDDFKRGWHREYWSVLQGEKSALYELGRGTRNLVGGLTGSDAQNAATAAFKKGDYLRGSLHEMQAIGEAGLTLLTLGEYQAARQAAGMLASERTAISLFPGAEAIVAARGTYTRPLGFDSAPQFQSFGNSLYTGFDSAGYPNVQAAFQGSSVTGRSYREGIAFDVDRVSDYDIAISSPELLDKAREVGVRLRGQGARTEPLSLEQTPHLIEQMGLTDISKQLSRQAGRPVNFMIYRSIEDALIRSPSIPVPRPR